MRGRKLLFCSAVSVLTLLLFAAAAFAAEEGGHGPDWKNLIFRIVNIIVVLAILYKAAGKKLAAFFSGRRKGIVEDFSSHEARREKAQAALADVERRIVSLETERKAILDEYRAQGEIMKAGIIARAEQAAAQIAEQARRGAENEAMQALEVIRAQMAGEIVEEAEKILCERLSAEEHQRLIDASLKRVVLH